MTAATAAPVQMVRDVVFRDEATVPADQVVPHVVRGKKCHYIDVTFDGVPVWGVLAASVSCTAGEATLVELECAESVVDMPDEPAPVGRIDGRDLLHPRPHGWARTHGPDGLPGDTITCYFYATTVTFA